MKSTHDRALRDVEDLQTYCYAVAGIVGEMLTELFILGRESLTPVAPDLRADSATFGEALQLVNILKDSASDRTEGRCYLPQNASRAEVFALAREDLAWRSRRHRNESRSVCDVRNTCGWHATDRPSWIHFKRPVGSLTSQ